MEWVLVILTSYGLHAGLELTEITYATEERCVAALEGFGADFEQLKRDDKKFAYTMRCEARAKG